ncbi:MAG: HAD family hydrolase [candidate division NC10 bacterium]|nr:HAD family hydrolase [candidate division NC10 bacterium]
MTIKGIIFDFDGVVVKLKLDFPAIKWEMFGSEEGFILERLETLQREERQKAEAILERHEARAAHEAEPLEGVLACLAWMEERGLKMAIVTRNSRRSIETVKQKLGLFFPMVVTREDAPPKPSPEPVLFACRRMDLKPEEVLLVGDGEFDMLAGKRAGVRTVLLKNPARPSSEHADFTINSLHELATLVEGIDPR